MWIILWYNYSVSNQPTLSAAASAVRIIKLVYKEYFCRYVHSRQEGGNERHTKHKGIRENIFRFFFLSPNPGAPVDWWVEYKNCELECCDVYRYSILVYTIYIYMSIRRRYIIPTYYMKIWIMNMTETYYYIIFELFWTLFFFTLSSRIYNSNVCLLFIDWVRNIIYN